MFHPMTGKPTKLKIHWYASHSNTPWGVQVSVACQPDRLKPSGDVIYCDDINNITCLKCMDVATRPLNVYGK